MNGSRRVLPRYDPPCLLKGHLSTKSNAFCTDSSSLRLNTLHLVKTHMAAHYNKILSAKAAVDCSVPVSISTSIKYADQQRREKLKRELARCEKELRLAKTIRQANSKNNSRSILSTLQKPAGEPQDEADVLIEGIREFPSFARSPVPSSERLLLGPCKSDKVLTSGTEENSSSSLTSMGHTVSQPRKPSSARPYSRGPRSAGPRSACPSPHRFQLVISKAPTGDLLDKHSELFSNKELPFTPRTLKTDAKSFLSQYRYYTPARRKKAQRIEAETQTEVSSFNSDFETAETENLTDSEVNIQQAPSCLTHGTREKTPLPSQKYGLTWDEIKEGVLQRSAPRTISKYSLQPSGRKIHSDEEELLYLSFIEDITDEILKLGFFSNRFLERLFERHIKENKHHLEERKMRHLLHVLKVNLGCISEQTSVKLNDADMLTLLDFEKTKNLKQNDFKKEHEITIQQEHQEYQTALDMLLSVQKDENEIFSPSNDFFLPIFKTKKYSEGVTIQQVNDEANLEPSTWDEKNPSVSDSLIDQETSVDVIEVDSDTEEVETSDALACLSPPFSQSAQFSRVTGDNNHDMKGPTLKIMEMSIDDCPLNV
ncbi:spermatogenesis-associated protein 7 isoform X1 [Elephas maximus indicus]|uniref:spermatogenesis-associated protein 7 isoform X1 n=1 Tax=Elephas maximus indicus TaxID=99487 RepID=UPI002115E5B9|nr:spermatogenesis-associated protein 7 isoform X1 [Elephas maximus indicus]